MRSCINYNTFRKLNVQLTQREVPKVIGADGGDLGSMGTVRLTLSIGSSKVTQNFIVCRELRRNIILGVDFAKRNCAGIQWTTNRTRVLSLNGIKAVEVEEDELGIPVTAAYHVKIPPRHNAVFEVNIHAETDGTQVIKGNKHLLEKHPNMYQHEIALMSEEKSRRFPLLAITNLDDVKTLHLAKGEVVGFAIPESSEVTYIATTNELNVEEVVDGKPRNWIPQRKWSSHTQRVPESQAVNSEFREHSRKSRPFQDRRERGEVPPARKLMTSMFQESTRESREHSQNSRWQGVAKENSGQPSTNYDAKNCEVEEHSQDSLKEEWCELNEVVESDFLISPGDIYPNRKVELEDADIKEATRVSFEALCEQQHEAFSKNNKDIGRTQLIEMEIDTGDSLPVAQSPYTLPLKHYDWVRQEIETLEKSGVIERSLSRWASPVIVVPKKSAPDEPPRRRLCVDYRKVNALQPEVKRTDKGTGCLSLYPLPKIDEMFSKLGGARIFSTIDLRSGYYHIGLTRESRAKSAFVVPMGKWQFKRTPFGLSQAPAYFQLLIDQVLMGCSGFAMGYLDDIIIFSKTEEEHLQHLEEIFIRLRKFGLKMKREKCSFFKKHIQYLGHLVSEDGFEPLPEKLESIRKMPAPRTAKEVKQFLGLIGYYRKFVPRFADISRPLTKLTRRNVVFEWTDQCSKAFNHLRELLMEYPILRYPDPKQGYILYTDASGIGWSGVLTQEHLDEKGKSKNHPICYVSGQFRGSQLNWAALTKEAYAIYMSVRRLSFYVTDAEVTIRSDHLPLKKFLNKQTMNSKVNNWAVELEQFRLHLEWIPGTRNLLADSLSRLLDVVPDAQKTKEPDDHEFGSYCFEELEPAKVMEKVSTEVIELKDNSEFPNDSQESRKSLEKPVESEISIEERAQDSYSEFSEHSQNSRTELAVKTFEIKFEEKPTERRTLLSGSECREDSQKSRESQCIEITEHEDLREIKLPLKQKQLQQLQMNDEYCRDVAKKLHKDTELQKIFIKEEGVLYRLWIEDGRTFKCILVPQVLQDFMIILAHDYSGHNGSRRTYNCLKRQYYWPGIRKQIFRHCKKCKECVLQNQGQPEKCFGHFDSPDLPMEFICMDLVGPIHPPSSRGNKYVLTVIDMLTGFTIAVPIKNKNAETICDAYRDNIYCVFGGSSRMLTDNGSEFKNKEIQEVCDTLGLKHIFSPVYTPQSNGRLEGWHRFFKACIAKHIRGGGVEWDELVPLAVSAYNFFPCQSSKESPFVLMFGRDPITPVAKLLEPKPRYYGERGAALKMDTLRRLYTVVVQNIRKAREKIPTKEEEPHKFKVNDMVLVKDPDAAVFEPRYQANFRVTAIFGNNRIEVQDERGHKSVRRSAHVKYIAPSEKVVNQLPSEQVVKNYGRSSKLLLAEKDIPNLDFNVTDTKEKGDSLETMEVMEITDVKTCGMTPQNSEFRELSRNSLESAAGEALERESEQRSVRQALNSKLHSNASECGEHSQKSRDSGKPTYVEMPRKLTKGTLIREMHLHHSECREHSQNSRINQPAGVEMTVSAEDAKTTPASSDFSKHSQNSLSKGEPNADPGEVKTNSGDHDGRCLRTVSEFRELFPNSRVVTEAPEDRHQHTKPVCISEPSDYSRDSLGVGKNVSVPSFSWFKSMSQIVGLRATLQDKVEGNPTGANTAGNAKVNISPVHTEFNFFL